MAIETKGAREEPAVLAPNGHSSSLLTRILRRPELGALAGTVLVFLVFGITAGDSGLSVLGSVLLLVPGFVTAFFGVLCLLPITRNALRGLATRLLMGPARRRAGTIHVKATRAHPVIDGEIDK